MQTFEDDLTLFDPRNPHAGDEKLPVQFYMGVTPDGSRTEELGRPVYKDEEYIRIFNSKDNIIDRPIRDTDKQRWPRQYAAWKNTGASEPGGSGTRLEHWPQVTRAQAEEMKFFKIFTVEQLAELPDSIGQSILGVQRLKSLAKAYVELAAGQAPMVHMQKELELRDGAIAELQSEVKRLTELIQKATSK